MNNEKMSLPEQVIYKLGELSSKVENGFNNLEKRLDDLHSDNEELECRVKELEKWQGNITSRISMIGGIGAIAWTFISPYIQALVGIKG